MEKENPYKIFQESLGDEIQYQFAIEEMGELLQAICKYKRKLTSGDEEKIKKAREDLQEEIADVLVSVEQLAYMFDNETIEQIKKEKIERALERAKKKNTEFKQNKDWKKNIKNFN